MTLVYVNIERQREGEREGEIIYKIYVSEGVKVVLDSLIKNTIL